MFRLTTVFVIAASMMFVSRVASRGRSFPIEITGTIISFNRPNQMFTIQVDEPARVLTIAVGRDCKFKRHGAPAGEEILTSGARARVRYFATIFTGNIAVEIESSPVPEVKTGVLEKVDRASRKLTIRLMDHSGLVMRWAVNAHFVRRGRKSSSANLRENAPVRVSYYSPAFGAKYAVRIELGQEFYAPSNCRTSNSAAMKILLPQTPAR